MKILLVNDDGYKSEMLHALAKALQKRNEVVVFAPKSEQSAKGHAMTFFTGIKAKSVNKYPYPLTIVDGTPGDCVSLALSLYKDFDCVISGINDGLNIGNDITYSGTVSAALEANMHHLPSVALSTLRGNVKETIDNIDYIAGIAIKTILRNKGIYCFNINFPENIKNNKGIRYTKMGQFFNNSEVELRKGRYYYKEYKMNYNPKADCDFNWLQKGYITITPVKTDKTDYNLLNK